MCAVADSTPSTRRSYPNAVLEARISAVERSIGTSPEPVLKQRGSGILGGLAEVHKDVCDIRRDVDNVRQQVESGRQEQADAMARLEQRLEQRFADLLAEVRRAGSSGRSPAPPAASARPTRITGRHVVGYAALIAALFGGGGLAGVIAAWRGEPGAPRREVPTGPPDAGPEKLGGVGP